MAARKTRDERLTEIMDTAQMLFFQHGYDDTSVQAIIDACGISKGTFYHYFDSKEELVDALAERFATQIMAVIQPIVDDADMDAVTKFQHLFQASGSFKAANREQIVLLLQANYRESNVTLRRKMEARAKAFTIPIYGAIIRQGVEEGVFDTPYPEEIGSMVVQMSMGYVDEFSAMFLREPQPGDRERLAMTMDILLNSIERLVGATPGSLQLFDMSVLDRFFPEEGGTT